MRKWALTLILAGSAWPAMAAKELTVGQLEQLLGTLRGKPDGKVARELSDVELTERVSLTRLAHWEEDFPGSRTHKALTKLADLSVFLNPPAADVIPLPAPDDETQERMLALAAEYVNTTITRLPNFFATRETMHFEETPYKSLHSTGSSSTSVMYRDGLEVHDSDTGHDKNQSRPSTGLTTGGEFGPILSVVMGDAMRGEVTWQRWEQRRERGASEPVAVFRYAAPKELSNYMVRFPSGGKIKDLYPGYHGEFAIDPASGAILRISILAELPPPYEAMQNAILVEYAPVTIGEQSYICPVRGVAYYKAPVAHAAVAHVGMAVEMQTQLNDVAFTQYHLFRSKARIVTDEGSMGDAPAGAAPPPARAESTGATPLDHQFAVASVAQQTGSPQQTAPDSGGHAPLPARAGSTGETPLDHQLAIASVAQQTGSPQQTAPNSGGVTIKVISRLTLVDVTATDAKDKPVHGLTQPEFTVNEDGKPQPIKNFEEYGTGGPVAQAAAPQLPPNVYSNALPSAPTTSAANIFMFDDVTLGIMSHPEYLSYARLQALKYLKTMPAVTQIAVLELADSLRIVQDFTTDQAVLLAAIGPIKFKQVPGAHFTPPPPPPPGARPNPIIVFEVCRAMNMQSELTLDALEGAAAFLAGVPGRKNLVWFTSGIPWLTDYPNYSSRFPCLRDYTPELQRAYGLLNAARVSLYPVDPQGPSVDPVDHFSIEEMAKATGGVAYYNRNDLDAAVSEAISTGADYYSLSYVPPISKYDGQFHKIDVKVDRPGVHLQYRDGYTAIDLAKPPKGAKTSAEKTPVQPGDESHTFFMNHGAAPSTEMLFDVRVTPSTAPAKPDDPPVMGQPDPALKGKPLVRYEFQYRLAANQITLSSDDNGKRRASMEFIMAAYDREGKMLNVVEQKVSFAVMTDQVAQFLQEPFQIPLRIDLPPGKIFVRMGVRDVPSGNVGTLEISVTVDKPRK